MGLFSWFSPKDVKSDSDILDALANSISTREAHLSEIRLRERRKSFMFTMWSMFGWVLYGLAWFFNFVPRLEGRKAFDWTITKSVDQTIRMGPGVVIPLVIYQIRRLVQWWYKRQENIEDRQLKKLRAEQKKKIEEIKTKHNFDKTRELIERYDNPRREDPNMSVRQRAITLSPSTPRTPIRPANTNGQPSFNTRTPIAAPQFALTPARPMQPPRRGWMDKFADKLLGDDDSTVGVAQSRYALICEKCFTHNGLVKESEWENTQYVCPKCGHFNLSDKAKKAGITSPSRLPIPVGSRISGPSSPQPSAPDTVESPSQDQPSPVRMDIDAS